MDELKTGGVVSIVGHPKASDGRYNYFEGKDGNYGTSQKIGQVDIPHTE
jgi:hypothetical protein